MTKRDFFKYLTRIHKWAGLVIGVQILLWVGSGLFMTLFPINEIRGRHIAVQVDLPVAQIPALSFEQALQKYDGQVTRAALVNYAGTLAYRMDGDGGIVTVNAQTGAALSPLSEAQIRRMALEYYFADEPIKRAALITDKTPNEYRRPGPVWQVQFDDRSKTRLYLDPNTAELKAVRTRLWRVYDTMWMLHIMDYKERDNFNSWWLRLAAAAALIFVLSGFGLLAHRFVLRPKRPKT